MILRRSSALVVRAGLCATAILFATTSITRNIQAADTDWEGTVDNDFFNAANWSNGVPNSPDDIAFIEGGNNLPVVIPADAGTLEIGAIRMGINELGGSLIQNGGTIILYPDNVGEKTYIGQMAEEDSSWVLNGNATILYDDPLGANGNGLDNDGTGKDFEVGESVLPGASGRLELHDNAVLRISDDLKMADGNGGTSFLVMDGNSKVTVGSGISVDNVSSISVSGSALLVTGNSADPGDNQQGRTNEGYLTLSSGAEDEITVDVSENGAIYARTLQMRQGVSVVNLSGNGQFHVFDAFNFSGPDLGVATVTGSSSGPQRTSNVSEASDSEMIFTLRDNAQMSIDSDLDDSSWSGFALSGGNNRGTSNTSGGYTLIDIADQASFAVQQDLNMTLGTSEAAESILRVTGPDATVFVGGDLRMALNEFGDENLGIATLEAVITASTHSTINVGGAAYIGNGDLVVKFDGYTPTGGEAYHLLSAGDVDGSSFLSTTLPDLPQGLSWNLVIDSQDINLFVSLPGDFNMNGVLDLADIDDLTQQSASETNPVDPYDLTGDGLVDQADVTFWAHELRKTWIGDANLDDYFDSQDLIDILAQSTYEMEVPAVWSSGDFNGDGRCDSSDLIDALADTGYENGQTYPGSGVAAVPEPSAVVLLTLGALTLLGARRRNG